MKERECASRDERIESQAMRARVQPRAPDRPRLASLAWALGAAVAASCKVAAPLDEGEYASGAGSVEVTVDRSACRADDAGCQDDRAEYLEIGTYAGRCPDADASAETGRISALLGAQLDGHEVLDAQGSPVPLTRLTRGPRAFFALVRDRGCGVLAWGCSDVDLGNQPGVRVALEPAPIPGMGACYGGSCACSAASDASSPEGGDGAVADGQRDCSLTLVAAGTLPAPAQPGDLVAGPAIAATPQGYVIAFREQALAGGSKSRLRTVLLRTDGTLSAPPPLSLGYYDTMCSGPIDDDGVGLVFQQGEGLAVVSEPACSGQGSGATFVSIAADGTLAASTLANSIGAGQRLSLAPAHALAPIPGGGGFAFAYVSDAVAYEATVTSTMPMPPTPMAPDASAALVATQDTLHAIVALVRGDAGTRADVYVGTNRPPGPVAFSVAGATAASVAVSADGGLVAAATPEELTIQGFDAFGAPLAHSVRLAGGIFGSVDIARMEAEGTYAVAGGRAAEVIVAKLGSASSVLTVPLSSHAVLAQLLSGFDGRRLAIASNAGTLGVTWLTSHVLAGDVPTGGWALFACR
jgi:hypothetical protein